MHKQKANYGIDAPVVVNLLLFKSIFSLIVFIIIVILGPASYMNNILWLFWLIAYFILACSIMCGATAVWMLYGIKITKPKIALKMIERLRLTGSEKVLDLGCGRGLLLIEAAKSLPQGEAHGIDLWSVVDQSGNAMKATLNNARVEEVEKRIHVQTGDIRTLPFQDATFDAVVSSLCIHNISGKKEREKALLELIRVLKPGGKFVIADIWRVKEYADFLSAHGTSVTYSQRIYSYCPPLRILQGKKTGL